MITVSTQIFVTLMILFNVNCSTNSGREIGTFLRRLSNHGAQKPLIIYQQDPAESAETDAKRWSDIVELRKRNEIPETLLKPFATASKHVKVLSDEDIAFIGWITQKLKHNYRSKPFLFSTNDPKGLFSTDDEKHYKTLCERYDKYAGPRTENIKQLEALMREVMIFKRRYKSTQIGTHIYRLSVDELVAIQGYTLGQYQDINEALRQHNGNINEINFNADLRRTIKLIDSALYKVMQKYPPQPTTLFRAQLLDTRTISMLQQPNAIITFNSFVSTSSEKKVANAFDTGSDSSEVRKVEVQIVGGIGARIRDLSLWLVTDAEVYEDNSNENEILLPRNTKFKVLHVLERQYLDWHRQMKSKWNIKLEQLTSVHLLNRLNIDYSVIFPIDPNEWHWLQKCESASMDFKIIFKDDKVQNIAENHWLYARPGITRWHSYALSVDEEQPTEFTIVSAADGAVRITNKNWPNTPAKTLCLAKTTDTKKVGRRLRVINERECNRNYRGKLYDCDFFLTGRHSITFDFPPTHSQNYKDIQL